MDQVSLRMFLCSLRFNKVFKLLCLEVKEVFSFLSIIQKDVLNPLIFPRTRPHPSLQGKAFCLRCRPSLLQFPSDLTLRQLLPLPQAFCVFLLPSSPFPDPPQSDLPLNKHRHPEVLLIDSSYYVVFRYLVVDQRIIPLCG